MWSWRWSYEVNDSKGVQGQGYKSLKEQGAPDNHEAG